MIKKIFIFSIIIYIIAVIIPFKNNNIIKLNPIVQKFIKKNNYSSNFEKTALKTEYIKENKIEFKKSNTYNIDDAPVINAKSAIVVDIKNNNILYAKNESERVPVASLAKIMTAIIAIEHSKLDNKFTVSKNSIEIGENTMGLLLGEKISLKNLLYGLILNSANDAAVTIAEGVAGTEAEFVDYMNKKSVLLGANDTLFVDSSGINKYDKKYYSTAIDLAKISKYSLGFTDLREIFKTVSYTVPKTDLNSEKFLENQTNLLTTYPGVAGMKTGYTEEAGLCLVSYAKNEDKELIVVILGSNDRKGDAILLLDYGFKKMGVNVEHNLL